MYSLNNPSFKPKMNCEHIFNCKSISEYAYYEDMNSGNRMAMEDGLNFLKQNKKNIIKKEHFAFDDFLKDGKSGFFGVLDGHNGEDVVRHCTKTIPEVQLLI